MRIKKVQDLSLEPVRCLVQDFSLGLLIKQSSDCKTFVDIISSKRIAIEKSTFNFMCILISARHDLKQNLDWNRIKLPLFQRGLEPVPNIGRDLSYQISNKFGYVQQNGYTYLI
jgi:hypothetical protein